MNMAYCTLQPDPSWLSFAYWSQETALWPGRQTEKTAVASNAVNQAILARALTKAQNLVSISSAEVAGYADEKRTAEQCAEPVGRGKMASR